MTRRALLGLWICAAAALAGEAGLLLADDFAGELSLERWEPVRVHDAKEDVIAAREGRLVLGLDTLGADDKTVKLRGVRSKEAFEVGPGAGLRVEALLDWNEQQNGCYLTLGLALVPEGAADPRTAAESLAYELVGVPPGKNVRPSLWRREAGALRQLFSDGWPQERPEDRTGRVPRPVRVGLEVKGDTVRLLEDSVERWAGKGGLSGRLKVWVFATGHSNYGLRSVRVDDLRVERIGP